MAPQNITQIKAGTRHWPDVTAIHMAEQCGIDPREALAGIALDKAAPEHRDLWADIVKRLRLDVSVVAAVGVLLAQHLGEFGQLWSNYAQGPIMTAGKGKLQVI